MAPVVAVLVDGGAPGPGAGPERDVQRSPVLRDPGLGRDQVVEGRPRPDGVGARRTPSITNRPSRCETAPIPSAGITTPVPTAGGPVSASVTTPASGAAGRGQDGSVQDCWRVRSVPDELYGDEGACDGPHPGGSEPAFHFSSGALGGGPDSRVSLATMTLSDPDLASLTARVRSGDRSAVERLFRALHPDLVRYGRGLADDAEAEDAVQEAFVTMWRRRETLDPDRSVRALLYASVRNRLLNLHRDTARRRDLLDTMDAPDRPPLPDAETAASLLADLVRAGIDALPVRQREALSLSRFDGLGYAEIADVMGCSVKTVENHIGRALRALRDHLGRVAPDAL